jgi:hypothetical protein
MSNSPVIPTLFPGEGQGPACVDIKASPFGPPLPEGERVGVRGFGGRRLIADAGPPLPTLSPPGRGVTTDRAC